MSANGEPKHGDVYVDEDGYIRILFSTANGVCQSVFISPTKKLSWLDCTTHPKAHVPKDAVHKFNVIDIINIILKDDHEHSD